MNMSIGRKLTAGVSFIVRWRGEKIGVKMAEALGVDGLVCFDQFEVNASADGCADDGWSRRKLEDEHRT